MATTATYTLSLHDALPISVGTAQHGERKLGDLARGGDPSDLAGVILREPESAVGAGRDRGGAAEARADRELGDHAGAGDPADVVAEELCEPEVTVGADRDAARATGGGGDRKLIDLHRDSPDGRSEQGDQH